ncbi:hypothetical protein OKW42_006037 [Paraburkholderia sp. WC7.3d]
MTTLADVGLSENLPEGRHLSVHHRLWSSAGPEVPLANICFAWKRAAYCSTTSSHIAMMVSGESAIATRMQKHPAGGWREKKHPSSRVPRIGRFNWHPDRYRPLIEFSSFVARASVDVRRAPLRSPALRTLCGLAAETNTPAEPVSKMQPTRELPGDALHQLVTVAEHAGVGHTSSGGEHD